MSGERDIRYQRSAQHFLECGGSPPLLHSSRTSIRSGVAHRVICHPDRSAGAVGQRGVEGSRHNPCAASALPIFEFRLSSFAFPASPPDPYSLIPDITQIRLPRCSQHNQIFRQHSRHPGSTIYRATTYPPVHSSRCYSYLFRLVQHGITQCRGGHA
jgi:hypothetical protein